MYEVEKREEELKKYEAAKTKLDSLDPETKALVLEAIRKTEFALRDEIAMINRNNSMAYVPNEGGKTR